RTPPLVASAAAVTPHFLATATALDLLVSGGSAIDAAIGANAVLSVVAPETCGIGGDLFALIHSPGDDRPAALNASGRAGANVDAQRLRDAGHPEMPTMDQSSVTTPGCVDGWHHLAAHGGKLSWKELLAPALTYAREGFPASEELSRALAKRVAEIGDQPIGRYLLPGGRPPRPGDQIVRPDQAATLEIIATGDRDGFYLGKPGRDIAAAVGGLITEQDLNTDQGDWVEPLGLDVFGLRAWTMPPNSQGYLTLASAAVFERTAAGIEPESPVGWHLQIESYRSQVADRSAVLSDPRHSPYPADSLLSDKRLAVRIDHERRQSYGSPSAGSGGTAYLCVIDGNGMGVSITQSNFMGLGTSIGAGDSGFFLHNRGAGFDLRPGSPNELAPGKRPLHTLAPTLWTNRSQLAALLGTRGGDHQPQLLLQMAIHLFVSGHDAATAQAHPRWVIETLADPEARIAVEESTPTEIVDGLRARGHQVEIAKGLQGGWGPVGVIRVSPDGSVEAAADPRVGTAAAESL
ncbi:MAG TPA: gamma-glutamyltransferase, partial [Acidimicrobiia bacterium]|nr:gamma-glutamyltransferase [Acidimicrobiia bacterium]